MPTDTEPVDKAIMKFRNHLSVILIKEKVNNFDNTISFKEIETNDVNKNICSWNPKKAGTDNDINEKIFKSCKHCVFHL